MELNGNPPSIWLRWANSLLYFSFHQLVATWGVGFAAFIGVASLLGMLRPLAPRVFTAHHVSWLLTELHFFPMQIVMALWCGWTFYRLFGHSSARWVWILPCAIIVYAIFQGPMLSFSYSSVLDRQDANVSSLKHYFGAACRVRDRCMDQLIFTMPFYASLAYSAGASLAQRFHREADFAEAAPNSDESVRQMG